MPKMVQHDFAYPLGHILTAKYWQNVQDGGLHLTVADTGWAKAAWGKIYGQWLCGSAVFVYDYDRFVPGRAARRHRQAQGHLLLRAADDLPLLHQGGPARSTISRALKYCTVAGEPLNPEVYQSLPGPDRALKLRRATARPR